MDRIQTWCGSCGGPVGDPLAMGLTLARVDQTDEDRAANVLRVGVEWKLEPEGVAALRASLEEHVAQHPHGFAVLVATVGGAPVELAQPVIVGTSEGMFTTATVPAPEGASSGVESPQPGPLGGFSA